MSPAHDADGAYRFLDEDELLGAGLDAGGPDEAHDLFAGRGGAPLVTGRRSRGGRLLLAALAGAMLVAAVTIAHRGGQAESPRPSTGSVPPPPASAAAPTARPQPVRRRSRPRHRRSSEHRAAVAAAPAAAAPVAAVPPPPATRPDEFGFEP